MSITRGSPGGSISAAGDVALPITGTTVQLADRSDPVFPTVEELFATRTIEATLAPASGPFVKPIFTAPMPLRIKDVWLANYGGALTQDGTNNWSYRLRRYRVASNFAADFVDILDQAGTNFNPQTSWLQGQAVRAYGVTYSETLATFRTGDVFALRIAANGTPTSLSELCVTVRWEPI